jgi:hypothetical protein
MKNSRCIRDSALGSRSPLFWSSAALVLVVLSIFALADSTFAQDDPTDEDASTVKTILSFSTMIGDPGNATAAAKAKDVIRGYMGPGSPWFIKSVQGTLKTDGSLTVMVKGLVLSNGTNPVPFFRAAVSCQDPADSNKGMLFFTKTFAADAAGNSDIAGTVKLPSHCIAPIVLITSPAEAGDADGVWFAVTGQ